MEIGDPLIQTTNQSVNKTFRLNILFFTDTIFHFMYSSSAFLVPFEMMTK